VDIIERAGESLLRRLMTELHYLGYIPKIGCSLCYVASDQDQRVALLIFSAAA